MINKSEEVSLSRIESFLRIESFIKGSGLYLHFKGNLVVKTGEALHSETGETLYLYKEWVPELEKFHPTQIWARPMGMFLENRPYSNELRFKPITPAEAAKLLYPVINKEYLKSKEQ